MARRRRIHDEPLRCAGLNLILLSFTQLRPAVPQSAHHPVHVQFAVGPEMTSEGLAFQLKLAGLVGVTGFGLETISTCDVAAPPSSGVPPGISRHLLGREAGSLHTLPFARPSACPVARSH